MNKSPTTSEIIIIAAGAVLFISSFLEWYGGPFGFSENGWGDGFFPIVPIIALFGLVMAGVIALSRFGNVDLPDEVGGFGWPQIHLALALFTVLITVSYLIRDKGGADIGVGLILALLSSIALLVGAVLLQKESPATAGPTGPAPPQSF